MIDRLEELLERLEAQEDEEEDGPERERSAVRPAPPAGGEPLREETGEAGEGAPEGPAAGGMSERAAGEARRREGELQALPARADAAPEPEEARREAQRAMEPAGAGPKKAQARDGLETLYRQTLRAAGPRLSAPQPGQAGRALRGEEPGRTAQLTVEELDRAVRRDSRRYDGGMGIF